MKHFYYTITLLFITLLLAVPCKAIELNEILIEAKRKNILPINTGLKNNFKHKLKNQTSLAKRDFTYLKELDPSEVIKNQVIIKLKDLSSEKLILDAIKEFNEELSQNIVIDQISNDNDEVNTQNHEQLSQTLTLEKDPRKKLLLTKKLEIIENGKKSFLELGLNRAYQVTFETDLDIDQLSELINFLNSKDFIEYTEPNFLLKLSIGSVNDPEYVLGNQWGLDKIQAGKAWGISTGDGVIVSVIDDGIDYSLPDLRNQVPYGYDFEQNDNTPMPNSSSDAHGTHIAGIIAAEANSTGVVGVAYDAKLMAMKSVSLEQAVQSLKASTDQGANVINCSWKFQFNSQFLYDAFSYVRSSGSLAVVAAGNDAVNSASTYPASFGNVLTVAATTISDSRSSFSNYGSVVDIAAPGSGILSTVPLPKGFDFFDGTSMAAPFVSGVAALIFSYNPLFDNQDVYSIIVSSADTIKTDLPIGSGRLNAYSALVYSMVFKAYYAVDINKDGNISSYEESNFFWVTRNNTYNFKFDIDNNAVINNNDLDFIVNVIYSGTASENATYNQSPINKVLSSVDVDGDGILSSLEIKSFKTGIKKAFKSYNARYDIDSNGRVNNYDKKVIISVFRTIGYAKYF